jgi:hypothetical protein
MPDQKLPLTSTTMIVGALPTDVRVVETRRPNRLGTDDSVHVQIARGPATGRLFGTLRDRQLVVVEITNGLVDIVRARGIEDQ